MTMLRRTIVLPALGRISEHTTPGSRLNTLIDHRLRRTIGRLSDRDIDRLNRIRQPRGLRP